MPRLPALPKRNTILHLFGDWLFQVLPGFFNTMWLNFSLVTGFSGHWTSIPVANFCALAIAEYNTKQDINKKVGNKLGRVCCASFSVCLSVSLLSLCLFFLCVSSFSVCLSVSLLSLCLSVSFCVLFITLSFCLSLISLYSPSFFPTNTSFFSPVTYPLLFHFQSALPDADELRLLKRVRQRGANVQLASVNLSSSDELSQSSFEPGRGEALATLCRIFCSNCCDERFLPVYLARFYYVVDHCLTFIPVSLCSDQTLLEILRSSRLANITLCIQNKMDRPISTFVEGSAA